MLVMITVLNEASVPGLGMMTCLIVLAVMVAIVAYLVDYISRVIAVTRDAGRNPQEEKLATTGRWRWFVLPVVISVIASTLVYNWPLHARFALSYEAFEQLQSRYDSDQPIPIGRPFQAGLYWVSIIERNGKIVFCTRQFIFGSWGFCKGQPIAGGVKQDALRGNWSVFEYAKD